MKKKITYLKESIGFNRKIVFFLVGLALVGITMGSFFTVILNDSDKSMVREYMKNFMEMIEHNKINFLSNFFMLSIEQVLFLVVIWLLGISVIGIPFIVFLYFSKAFTLGFSISSFVLNYKAKGLLYSFLYIFPHGIFNFILYIILLNYAITLSYKLVRSFLQKRTIDFKVIMKKYSMILLITILGILFTSLYESFVVPQLLKVSLSIFI